MPQPDYENDLVFPPRHDKTALELQQENNKLKRDLEIADRAYDALLKEYEELKKELGR